MLNQFDVVQVEVTFSEDTSRGKVRPAVVLQQDGELVQLIWATTKEVDRSAPQPWEFCVTSGQEMTAMGHTKAARYSFRRGGVIVVRASEVREVIGHCPSGVVDRLVRAARQA